MPNKGTSCQRERTGLEHLGMLHVLCSLPPLLAQLLLPHHSMVPLPANAKQTESPWQTSPRPRFGKSPNKKVAGWTQGTYVFGSVFRVVSVITIRFC